MISTMIMILEIPPIKHFATSQLRYLVTSLLLLLTPSLFAQFPEINWWFDTHDASFGQTAAGDIDHDGYLELIFGCYRNDSSVYALNSEDARFYGNTILLLQGLKDAMMSPLSYMMSIMMTPWMLLFLLHALQRPFVSTGIQVN